MTSRCDNRTQLSAILRSNVLSSQAGPDSSVPPARITKLTPIFFTLRFALGSRSHRNLHDPSRTHFHYSTMIAHHRRNAALRGDEVLPFKRCAINHIDRTDDGSLSRLSRKVLIRVSLKSPAVAYDAAAGAALRYFVDPTECFQFITFALRAGLSSLTLHFFACPPPI